MNNRRESFFWTSYSDLMTSLFFIMLVLFVLALAVMYHRNISLGTTTDVITTLKDSISDLKKQNDTLLKEIKVSEDQFRKIEEVQKSTKDLSREFFSYNEIYKKYVLNVNCHFEVDHDNIYELPFNTRDSLRMAGEEINSFLSKRAENKYLLVVEGQASRDSEYQSQYNYNLSFRRALALVNYWFSDCNIRFRSNCEIQIAGSGDGRLNVNPMRDYVEENNQRFMIHIVPKNIIEDN